MNKKEREKYVVIKAWQRICLAINILVLCMLFYCPVLAASNNTYALLISGASGDDNWGATDKSVKKIKDIISKNKLEDYSGKKKITIFKNKEKDNRTKKDLNKYIDKAYKGAKSNDLAIFYYNGHSNGRRGLSLNGKNRYSHEELAKYLNKKIKCKKIVVILDTCYADQFREKGLLKLSKKDRKRFIAFMACRTDETASSRWGNSEFTKYLTEGLGYNSNKFPADINQDGVITVQELDFYIDKKVKQQTVTFTDNVNWITYQYKLSSAKINKQYATYMKQHNMNGCYYAIINVGKNKAPVLMVADSGNAFQGQNIWSSSYTPDGGYPIILYTFTKGKVTKISKRIVQRISAGPWFIYKNKLCAYMARGGYRVLNIFSKTYKNEYKSKIPEEMYKKGKVIKLKRFDG